MVSGTLENIVKFAVDQNSVNQVTNVAKGIQSTINRYLGMIGIGLSLKSMNDLIEVYSQVSDSLAAAVDEAEDLSAVQDKILASAQASRTSYTDMATSVSKLVQAGSDLFDVDSATQYVELVTKLLKANGVGDSSISSILNSMNRSMQNGTVTTQTITLLQSQAPKALDLIAKKLNTTTENLKKMASSGSITAKQLRDAFLDSAGEIETAFGKLDVGFSDALLYIKNYWGTFLFKMKETTGIPNEIATIMMETADKVYAFLNEKVLPFTEKLTKQMGGARNLLKAIVIVVGSLAAATGSLGIAKIVSSVGSLNSKLKDMHTSLGLVSKKVLIVVAVLASLYLIIDDIVGFMNGKDSLFGRMLEKTGIDAESVRSTIREMANSFKELFSNKEFLASVVTLLESLGTLLMTIVSEVGVPLLVSLFESLATIFNELAKDGVIDSLIEIMSSLTDILSELLILFGDIISSDLGKSLVHALNEELKITAAVLEEIVGYISQVFGGDNDIISGTKDIIENGANEENTSQVTNGIKDAASGAWNFTNKYLMPFVTGGSYVTIPSTEKTSTKNKTTTTDLDKASKGTLDNIWSFAKNYAVPFMSSLVTGSSTYVSPKTKANATTNTTKNTTNNKNSTVNVNSNITNNFTVDKNSTKSISDAANKNYGSLSSLLGRSLQYGR